MSILTNSIGASLIALVASGAAWADASLQSAGALAFDDANLSGYVCDLYQ